MVKDKINGMKTVACNINDVVAAAMSREKSAKYPMIIIATLAKKSIGRNLTMLTLSVFLNFCL